VITAQTHAVSVPAHVTVTGPVPYTVAGNGISALVPVEMTTFRPVTACVPSTFGIGIVTFADAELGPTTYSPIPAPVGRVSTDPVVGAVRVMTAPACGGPCTVKAVILSPLL